MIEPIITNFVKLKMYSFCLGCVIFAIPNLEKRFPDTCEGRVPDPAVSDNSGVS